MALLDIFKRKKIEEKEIKKPAKVKVEKKPEKKPIPSADVLKSRKDKEKEELKVEAPRAKAKISGRAWRVLKGPHITEKATALEKENKYIFKVWSRVNKIEVKKAVEDLYGVEVTSVRIVRIPRKRRRLGRISGWRKGYRKAIVTVKEGQKIELLPR